MKQLHYTKIMVAGLCATLLLTKGGTTVSARSTQPPPALAADHVIACIRTAVAAQAGLIKEVEVKHKRGQWLCEVKIVDDAGQKYELHVDVTTNQVVKAERD